MINRLFGVLFALITIAVITFAALNAGNYRSLCFTDEPTSPAEELPIIEVTEEVLSLTEEDEVREPLPQSGVADTLNVAEPISATSEL